jgi:glycerol-3-phosphate acyltransferase PlsY
MSLVISHWSLVIIVSYLLGSLPFGYIITTLSKKKNILEIGWRKTSGSNVFRNIGFWQGLLTGILDVGKGFLAVKLAQNFGLSPLTQTLCGLAAVTGHNWSIFLKFAGGRGIGTLIGAFLALSPGILGYSLIPFALLALIWNASIGTIFFLTTALILAIYLGQMETVGILTLVSLIPIFLKRLSPIKELSLKRKDLIRNRLIFDNDELCLDLRIKRIIKRLTKP